MKVKFKKLRENAKLPVKKHDGDFCYDVYACTCEEVAPNVYKYMLGFSLQIAEDEELMIPTSEGKYHWQTVGDRVITYYGTNLSVDFRPRSSIWETGMVLANSCGTGDRPYTGEYAAYFYHVVPELPIYKVGDRILQMKIGITVPIEFEEVDELNKTDRGDGGFGSTGKN